MYILFLSLSFFVIFGRETFVFELYMPLKFAKVSGEILLCILLICIIYFYFILFLELLNKLSQALLNIMLD